MSSVTTVRRGVPLPLGTHEGILSCQANLASQDVHRSGSTSSSTVQTFAGVGFGFFIATVTGATLSFTRWESLFLIGLAIGVLVSVGVVALKPSSRTRNILGQQIDAYTWALESPDPTIDDDT